MAEVKTDCFAYNEATKRCSILSYTYCIDNDKCNFYKTKEQRCEGCKNAKGRIFTCEECKKRML